MRASSPSSPDLNDAIGHHQAGRLDQALAHYDALLTKNPQHAQALQLKGIALLQQGRPQDGLVCLERALRKCPHDARLHYNLGVACQQLGRLEAAVAHYTAATAGPAPSLDAQLNLVTVLHRLKRLPEAWQRLEAVLHQHPQHVDALMNAGVLAHDLGWLDRSLDLLVQALALDYDKAETHFNLGRTLFALQRGPEAIAAYEAAIAREPRYAKAFNGLGCVAQSMGAHASAKAFFDQALALDPDEAQTWVNRALYWKEQKDHARLQSDLAQALRLDPKVDGAQGLLIQSQLDTCDWSAWPQALAAYQAGVLADAAAIEPFPLLAISDDPQLQLQLARRHVQRKHAAPAPARPPAVQRAGDRVRVAYCSADFFAHATTHLMAELFEVQDHPRLEWHAFAYGQAPADAVTGQVEAAFEGRFHPVSSRSDVEVAAQMRQLGIDIVVDLKGYTKDGRLGILAHRPAPVQVSYLGYPGTTGAPFVDYLAADAVLVPPPLRAHYSEKIIELPGCYQVNDSRRHRPRASADRQAQRRRWGLPAEGFVFCSFNAHYKLNPPLFEVWMRLLRAHPDSVLWALVDSPLAQTHLQAQAQAHGVAPQRLVFAPRLPMNEHLDRYPLADLFLDSWPCNAHTTASDALWAGLPVLTLAGRSFASRVGASLLHGVDLPELVTDNWADYEALAQRCVREPTWLASLRSRLAQAADRAALFQARVFAQHWQNALLALHARQQQGLPPSHLNAQLRFED